MEENKKRLPKMLRKQKIGVLFFYSKKLLILINYTMRLSELKIGEYGRVTALNLPDHTKNRLINMGVAEGVTVKLIRVAPFNDPIEIGVKDFFIAIRIKEAQNIEILPVEGVKDAD